MIEKAELWARFDQLRDEETRGALIEAYLPLVRQIASGVIKKLRSGVDFQDLVSDGVFGLMRAVDQFDLNRGVKFETYASPAIRGAIYNGLRRLDWMPERTRGKVRELQKAMDKFTLLYGRPGTEEELADELKLSSKEVYDLIADLGCVYIFSLDQPFQAFTDGDESTIMEVVEDAKSTDPTLMVEFEEERRLLRQAISQLDQRDQLLLKLHYSDGVTFEEIANRMGITKQRISQIHARAVRRLRECLSGEAIRNEAMEQFSF